METWPLLAGDKVEVVLVKVGWLVRARATAPDSVCVCVWSVVTVTPT